MGNTLPAANAYFYFYLYLYTCLSATKRALQMFFDSRLSRRKLLKSLELRLSGFPFHSTVDKMAKFGREKM